ncbi:hypothetical protein HWV62_29909 [Athelia sp. TMB]|nr:hypothetical protein HWV62_29909 [Athelia sp. TMB]
MIGEFDRSKPDAAAVADARISPIDTLPNELLAHIFTVGTALSPKEPILSQSHLDFALLVCTVSRLWRAIAFSSPPLWSRLVFTGSQRAQECCTKVLLPRSGSHPLDIVINCSAQEVRRVLDMVLPHSQRWRELSISAWDDEQDFQHVLKPLRDISVPLLQHVEIKCEEDDGFHGFRTPHHACFVLGAPALHSVRLRGLCMGCGPSLTNLNTLRLDSKTIALEQEQLETAISASPALRCLQLRLQSFTPSRSSAIKIPSLRELSLNLRGCHHSKHLLWLFATIFAPALECLELVSLNALDIEVLRTSCQEYPQYSRPHTLKLSSIKAEPSDYDALLSLFPAIKSLYLLDSSGKPTLSRLSSLKSITNEDPTQWLLKHVKDCHGTLQAMDTVRVARPVIEEFPDLVIAFGAVHPMLIRAHAERKRVREADWQTLRDLVNLVEVADDDDCLRDSWEIDRWTERDESEGPRYHVERRWGY